METKRKRPFVPKFGIDQTNFNNSADIQNFILQQLWVTGGKILTSVGTTTTQKIQWGGQSRWHIGVNFFCNTPTAHILSYELNQEKIFDSVPLIFMFPLGNIRFMQYYEFIRPLSGSDTLTVSLTSTVAEDVFYSIYMTREYNKYYVRQ
jgi:hypothetical protein